VNKIKELSVIFNEGPISRSYINFLKMKGLLDIKIIYLSENNLLPNFINSYLKFHKYNYYPIKFLKNKKIKYFTDQVEEYFNVKQNFIKDMYSQKNLDFFKNITYIKDANINSQKLFEHIKEDKNIFFLNTGKQIIKKILDANKKIIHIHPGYLPEVKGADGSLHSIDKFNILGSSSFFVNQKIDEGEIIYRRKFEYKKFKILDYENYSLRDIYRLWFSFVDPLIRVSHLNYLVEKNFLNERAPNKINTSNEDSNYYTYMNNNELRRTFEKIFD
tara:strand:- start:7416 stop:8237 length:822 start_codon:yes stop_codon:yes gene_type:complete